MQVPFSQILGEKSPLKLPDLELLEAQFFSLGWGLGVRV